jgi:ribosome-binding ATPase YchF (GTP1/OBG family)
METVSYDDMVACGSWSAAQTAGKLRIEGKDYVVQDGDVIHVRFSV